MKRLGLFILTIVLLSSCTLMNQKKTLKKSKYKNMYKEKPTSIILMPPINETNYVEAKDYFYTSLMHPLAEQGFYVVPPFLAYEVLKQESAYDAELFIKGDVAQFGQVFGADAALFTVIKSWKKSTLNANITVKLEYILKSTKTNKILFHIEGTVVKDISSNAGGSGLIGAAISLAATAVSMAVAKQISVARDANNYALSVMPSGPYSPEYLKDKEEAAPSDKFYVEL